MRGAGLLTSRLPVVLALVLAVQGAQAQQTSGKPMDADDFQAQPGAGGNGMQADPRMQEVIRQGLNGNSLIPPAEAPEVPQGPQPMWSLGVAEKTCKDLLSPAAETPSLGLEAQAWAEGFWTGLNTLDSKSHNVGKQTDTKKIMADLTKHCQTNSDQTLLMDVSEVYAEYLTNGQ